MLNFITTKSDKRHEWRIYTDIDTEIDGAIIYKGHKLGVTEDILLNILELKLERNSDRIHIRDYENNNNWFVGNRTNPYDALNKSYYSLQKRIEDEIGKFKKVTITRF